MKKKFIKSLKIILFLALLVLFISNLSNGWLFVKFNGNLYVAGGTGLSEYEVKESLGEIERNTLSFMRPLTNKSSNGFPKGSELYSTELDFELVVKYEDKYYSLSNIKKAEGWGNAIKIKIKNGKVVY